MLSRAACAPRLCLACRVGLAQRIAVAGARLSPSSRRLASGFGSGAQDKSRVEALISGKTTFEKDRRDRRAATKSQGKAKRQGKARPRQQEELGWGGDVMAKKTTKSTIPTPISDLNDQSLPVVDAQSKQDVESKQDPQPTLDPEAQAAPSETQRTPRPPKEKSIVTQILDGDFVGENDPSFDWRAGLSDPFGEPDPNFEVRSAASPDEVFPDFDVPEEDVSEPFEWPEEKRWADGTQQPGPSADPFLAEEGAERRPERRSRHRSEEDLDGTSERHEERRAFRGDDSQEYLSLRGPREDEMFRQHQLALGAMGKRINTLIMKNPNRLNKKNKKRSEVTQDKKTTSEATIDWQSLVPADDADIQNAASVAQNIESLRPLDISIVPKAEFLRLQERLMDFTIKQLAVYHKSQVDVSSSAIVSEPKYPWLLSQSTWTPSNPIFIEDKTTKPQIATRILTKNWKLQIQEEVESPGDTTVKVRPNAFQLIAQTQTGILGVLAAEMLDDTIGETVTPVHATSSIQIYARKAVIPAIMTELNHLLESTVTQTVPTNDIHPSRLNKGELSELARVTKTVIKRVKGTTKLEISWISVDPSETQDDDSPLPMENTADTVLRLLRGRPSDSIMSSEQIILRDIPSDAELVRLGKLTAHCRETRSLAWRDRLSYWSRIVGPAGKAEDTSSQSLKLGVKVWLPEPKSITSEDGATTHLSATFGHVLHPNPRRTEQSEPRTEKTKNYRRILAPVVPHPAAFTDLSPALDEEMEKQTSIILNFVASSGTDGFEAPEVRLQLPIHPEDDFSNFTMSDEATLKVVEPRCVEDILVPEETVDVRIAEQQETPLDISKQPFIQEFFEASDFNLIEGRLQTPSKTKIKLPRNLINKRSPSTSIMDVPYYFAGLEIHQNVNIQFKKHTLRYSSIEAGQHGGTRQELSIVANVTSDDPEEAANQRKSFLRLVGTAIEGRFWSWSNGADKIRELPEEDEYVWEPPMGAIPREPVQYSPSRTLVEDVPEWSAGEEAVREKTESPTTDTHQSLLYRDEGDVNEDDPQRKAARSLRELLADHDETGENMVSQDGHTFVKDVFLDADAQPVGGEAEVASQAGDVSVSQEIKDADKQTKDIIQNGQQIVREAEATLKAIYSSENTHE